MANHASAIKRNRQRVRKTARNRAAKASLRTDLKKARSGLADGQAAANVLLVHAASSALDRAASKGTIPPKRASRVKGRLACALHKAKAV
jgi:small subunit ribosomal protein S20